VYATSVRHAVRRPGSDRPATRRVRHTPGVGKVAGSPLVIVNPAASRLADPGHRATVTTGLLRAVEARTGRTALLVNSTPEAAREALAAAVEAPLVAVAGGDGTIREALTTLAGTDVPLGIVPAGTGNVFAAALGIPRRVPDAVRIVGSGRAARVDLGRVSWGRAGDGEPGNAMFAVACGLGLDARVMAAATLELKQRFGFFAYVVATVAEATRLRPVAFRIEVDGDVHEVVGLFVLVANCGQLIPGVVGPRHPIDPTDGLLDVIVILGPGVTGGLVGSAETLLAAGPPPHRRARSLRFHARHVRIDADPPEPVQIDGDPGVADWLDATSLPGALTVLRG
jgi:diacylglycerol kinase (ATP)